MTKPKPKAKPAAPVREKVGERVRRQILDHAEALFAERGFFGTSIRDVTQRADLRLAAVNYHFGTKEELFRSVLLRRADVLAQERMQLLQQVPQRGSARTRTRALVQAFISPVATRALDHDPGFAHYFALVAQVSAMRLWALTLVAEHFNHVALAFVSALGSIYPRASERTRHHAYQLLLAGTLYAFSNNGRLDSLTRGKLRSDDFARLSQDLVTLMTAGIVALCATPKGRDSR